eukprot:100959_1
MGNKQKQKKNMVPVSFISNYEHKRSKSSSPLHEDIVCSIVSYWARIHGLSDMSFQHLSSNIIMNTIHSFTKSSYFIKLAERILSIGDMTPKQLKKYAETKANKLDYNMLSVISRTDILRLCDDVEAILRTEQTLLKLNPKHDQNLIICGDIRGDLFSLFHHFNSIHTDCNNIIHKISTYNDIYLFLGSYVCRGKHSIECICLLYCLKLMFPQNIYLLRGYLECGSLNRIYGFYDELKKCYPISGIYIWKRINLTFQWLSIGAVINDEWFAVHSGLSPELPRLDILNTEEYCKPLDVEDTGVVCDLLWSTPENISGWTGVDRGVSYWYGRDVVEEWLKSNNLKKIIRAHDVVENGFEWWWGNTLLTLFSCADYCGEFDNDGAIVIVDCDRKLHFKVMRSTKTSK